MADKDKKARAIDGQPAVDVGGVPLTSLPAAAPPAVGNVPAPFNLTLATAVLFSAVSPEAGINATWQPGGGTNPGGYYIQYSTLSTFPTDQTVTLQTYTSSALLDGLQVNVLYYVRVASIFHSIVSGWSDVASTVTAVDLTPPSPVAQSSMSWSWPIGDLTLKWTNPTNTNFRDVRVQIWSDTSKTILYVDTFSSTGAYTFSAAQNFSVTSGAPDPSLYVELTSRSWNNVYAAPTTFGAASTPTTQPVKPKPNVPVGLAADFTGADCIFTWTRSTDADDYVITIDGIDYVTADVRYVYSFWLNRVAHSGTPDPVLTYTLKARDGLLQTSNATSSATATNLPPPTLTTFTTNWDSDVGYADESIAADWNTYSAPVDIDYYKITVYTTAFGTGDGQVTQDKSYTYPYSRNKTFFGGNGAPSVTVRIVPTDVFGQTPAAVTERVITNAAPPIPTILIAGGFSAVFVQLTNTAPVRDFDHYTFKVYKDAVVQQTFNDVIDTALLSVTAVGNYTVGVQQYDLFQQARTEIISNSVFIDALTIAQLRAEGTYSDSISTDFSADPNKSILKNNAIGGGISYSATTANVGKTAIGVAGTQDLAADFKRVTAYTMPNAGSITTLSVYCSGAGAGSGAQSMRGIVYGQTGSTPGSLLGVTNDVSVADGQAAGWLTLSFTTPISVSAGQVIYLGVHGGANTNTIRLYRDTLTNAALTSTDTFSDGSNATFGSVTAGNNVASIYVTYTPSVYKWVQFERPLSKLYRRMTVKLGNSTAAQVYFALSNDGSTWRWFAGIDPTDGYTLTEYATQALAAAQAQGIIADAPYGSYIYQFVELPVEVEARYVRLYISGSCRLDEWYPRTMVMSDDIAAEAIRAINISAGAITADAIGALAVTAVKLDVGIGGGNLLTDSGFMYGYGTNNWGYYAPTAGTSVTPQFFPAVAETPGYNYLRLQNVTPAVHQDYLYQDVTSGFYPGSKVTMSGMVYVGGSNTVQLYAATGTDTTFATVTGSFVSPALPTVPGTWQHVEYTFTVPAGSNALRFHWALNFVAVGDVFGIAGSMLESGDVFTSWSPGYRGNVHVDGYGILVGVYNGARTELTQGGLIGYNSGGVEQVRIDSVTGTLRAGVSAVAQRIEIKAGGLYGYNSANTEQVRIQSSDGKLIAGAGAIYLDANGVSVISNSGATATDVNSYKFVTSGGVTNGSMYSFINGTALNQGIQAFGSYAGGINIPIVVSNSVGGGTISLRSQNPSSFSTNAIISASHSGTTSNISITAANQITVSGNVQFAAGANSVGTLGISTAPVNHIRVYVLGVGTTNGTYGLAVTDGVGVNNMYVRDDGFGYLRAGAWSYGSDERMKENIRPYDKGLEYLVRLESMLFDYRSGTKDQVGFIAQHFRKEFPELVDEGIDGMLSIRYDGLFGPIINALKELDARCL